MFDPYSFVSILSHQRVGLCTTHHFSHCSGLPAPVCFSSTARLKIKVSMDTPILVRAIKSMFSLVASRFKSHPQYPVRYR